MVEKVKSKTSEKKPKKSLEDKNPPIINKIKLKVDNKEPPSKKPSKKDKPHQLIGSFNFVQKEITKRKGNHYGETFFKIDVKNKIENMPNEMINTIYAFPDVVSREQVWKDLEENEWADKRYILFCYYNRYWKLYRLFDWKEINNSSMK